MQFYYLQGNEVKNENLTSGTNTLFFKGNLTKVDKPFYNRDLLKFDKQIYSDIQELLNDVFDVQIPDYDFLFAYNLKSLRILQNVNVLKLESYTFTESEIRRFLQFVDAVDIKLFDTYSDRKSVV